MARIGIVGGTGYTGVELLRLLASHPEAELAAITSRGNAGTPVAEMFPSLRGRVDLHFTAPDDAPLEQCDLVFFATPHGTAMAAAPALLDKGVKVVDLGPDFRLRDAQAWSQWYGMEHSCPELLNEAVYGLPELYRSAIAGASLVANPGCYPTAVKLALMPLLEKGLVDASRLIADAKSGVSGAGRQPKVHTLLCEANENFNSYGASGHRHLPEIMQGLRTMTDAEVGLVFVPHLVPMTRGMQATCYAPLLGPEDNLQALYEARYEEEPFVDVMPYGSHPQTASVRGTNMCRIGLHKQPGSNVCIVLSVIDNLVKGAAGQAVQNMNLMLGFDETAGLNQIATVP